MLPEEERLALFNEHFESAFDVAMRRLYPHRPAYSDRDDLKQVAALECWRGLEKFDSSHAGTAGGFFYRVIRNAVLPEIWRTSGPCELRERRGGMTIQQLLEENGLLDCSLDAAVADDEGGAARYEVIGDEDARVEAPARAPLSADEVFRELRCYCNHTRDRRVLKLWLGGHGAERIGRLMGSSRQAVDQAVDRILKRVPVEVIQRLAGRRHG